MNSAYKRFVTGMDRIVEKLGKEAATATIRAQLFPASIWIPSCIAALIEIEAIPVLPEPDFAEAPDERFA
jgi:hypothetical protein